MNELERLSGWHRRAMRAGRLAAALGLVFLTLAAPVQVQEASFPELDAQLEPLRAQFNADAGKVRLILLLDPT